jgi:hypothetical protein
MKQIFTLLTAGLLISQLQYAQTYNYYFGNIHAQTTYSDGNQDSATSHMTTPLQAFTYAKASQHIDFYGISDHNHQSAGMKSSTYYHMGIADANTANQDGIFVAMYGMEYGVISNGGHIIVYGSDKLIGWDPTDDVANAEFDYAGLFAKVNNIPNSFAYLAHPQVGDYTNLLSSAAYSVAADSALVGTPARSGPAFSTNASYSNPSTGSYVTQYQAALAKGYHVGIGLDHDTHNSVFGRQTAGRLVVLAPSLTRANIYQAFRKRHFYASDDWNAKVDFNILANPMGSILALPGNPTLNINVSDPDNEAVVSIKVYGGIPGSGATCTLIGSNTGSSSYSFSPTMANGATYYYYAMIQQADGDFIWTSPIWYTRKDNPTSPPVASFAVPVNGECAGSPIAMTDNSANSPTTWAWSFPNGVPATAVVRNPSVTYTLPGTYTISLNATNANGKDSTSQIITVSAPPATPTVTLTGTLLTSSTAFSYQWNFNANPIPASTQQICNGSQTGNYSVCITDAAGCTSCSAPIAFALGIKEDPTGGTIRIYPNPGNGLFQISFDLQNAGTYTIELSNVIGQQVYAETLDLSGGSHVKDFDVKKSGAGLYLLTIKNATQQVIRKVVVN